MRTVPVAEAKKSFSKILEDAQKEEIIVTKHGRAVARVSGVKGSDVARIAGEEAFGQMLLDRYRGPRVSSDEMWSRLGVTSRKKKRRKS